MSKTEPTGAPAPPPPPCISFSRLREELCKLEIYLAARTHGAGQPATFHDIAFRRLDVGQLLTALEIEARQAEPMAPAPPPLDPPKDWLIYNSDYGQFWGPNSGGYGGLWFAGLYTEREAKRLASNKDRRDKAQHISEYRDQIGNMRGAFERLDAALNPLRAAAAPASQRLESIENTEDQAPRVGGVPKSDHGEREER